MLIPIIAISGLTLLCLSLLACLIWEHRHAFLRERILIHFILTKNLTELAAVQKNLLSTPEDVKDITKLQNKLAELAAQLNPDADSIPLI
jgi:hypothetical protein